MATRGGRTLWLAGVGMREDEEGNSLVGDFEGQVHATFKASRAGGTLQDIVTMTVFTLEVRYGDLFTELRRQYFSDGYPGSALITVAGFAHPDMMLEIQAIAVVGDE